MRWVRGLFVINLGMLASFMAWGLLMPRLAARGIGPEPLIAWGWPLGAVVLLVIIALGPAADTAWLALWCVCIRVIALCQPAVAQAYPKAEAGRARSAFNLVIFLGVFTGQWGMGLAIDAVTAAGWAQAPTSRLDGIAVAGHDRRRYVVLGPSEVQRTQAVGRGPRIIGTNGPTWQVC